MTASMIAGERITGWLQLETANMLPSRPSAGIAAALSNYIAEYPLRYMAIQSPQQRASAASPPSPPVLGPDVPIETTDQLRIAIDQGEGGDKVDAADPAAAPLGTDDEAGGSPDSAGQVALAAAQEVRARPAVERQRNSGIGSAWCLIGLSLFIGFGMVACVLWLRT